MTEPGSTEWRNSHSLPPEELRRQAEQSLRKTRCDIAEMPVEDVQSLVHELQVHQVELEMQNEELRRTQMELAASRDRFLDLYDFAPCGYVNLDADGMIVEANLRAAQLLGADRSLLIGQRLSRFVAAKDANAFHLHRQEVFSSGVKQVGELEFCVRDTPPRVIRLETVAVVGDPGDTWQCQTALSDVTERIRAEQALQTLNASLDEQIKQRTGQLQEANEELVRSNQDLQQFAYAISHDLREPLRAVTGFSQLLQHRYAGQLAGEADEFILDILDGASRMQELLDGLLAYARLGTGGAVVTSVDAAETLAQALANLCPAIDDAQAQITHGDLPVLQADHTQLVQLFQNLVGNAVKYHGTRRPEVHVAARRTGGDWQIDVQDNGIGIAAEYLQNIFDIFDRLHTRDAYPGMGIGLALCKRIVDRHGGRIWVTSHPGRGSTFSFTIADRGNRPP